MTEATSRPADTAALIAELSVALGTPHVLTGRDCDRYARDATGDYNGAPAAVARPADTAQVAEVLRIAARHGVGVVPISGNTGITGATMTRGELMISLERLNRIRDIRADARVAVVESGVVLSRLHDAAAELDLYFPLWFGARGSAMIGGALSTNAGGSNVLRYGSTRGLVLGVEVVLADGRVLDLMSELHKDNSGYDLKDLFIGAEGTLGIITAAVVKLVPAPRAKATAMLTVPGLPQALVLLNRLQQASGGLVEAFEYMPDSHLRALMKYRPDLGLPFAEIAPVSILVELGATAPALADTAPDGSVPLVDLLEETLASMMEEGLVGDALVARSEAQREAIWARREASAEVVFARHPCIDTDVAVPLDRVQDFLTAMEVRLQQIDPGADAVTVAHLGDGNLHYSAYPTRDDPALKDRIIEAIEDCVADLHGSFSAEHGIGLSKRKSMARRKDPVAIEVMRAIKAALDPDNRMNPGKVLPDAR